MTKPNGYAVRNRGNTYTSVVAPTNAAGGNIGGAGLDYVNTGTVNSLTVILSGASGAGFSGILVWTICITGFNAAAPFDSAVKLFASASAQT